MQTKMYDCPRRLPWQISIFSSDSEHEPAGDKCRGSQLSRNEGDPDNLQENVALNIPKTQGENAIQILPKRKLPNGKLAPQTTDDVRHAPLAPAPQPAEQNQLDTD